MTLLSELRAELAGQLAGTPAGESQTFELEGWDDHGNDGLFEFEAILIRRSEQVDVYRLNDGRTARFNRYTTKMTGL